MLLLTVTINLFSGLEFHDVEVELDPNGKFQDVIVLACDLCGIRPDDVSSFVIVGTTWIAER